MGCHFGFPGDHEGSRSFQLVATYHHNQFVRSEYWAKLDNLLSESRTMIQETTPPDGLHQNSDNFVRSFARGLAVISSFNEHAQRQTLSEVAESAGLARAAARRILLTLQTLGYVKTDGKFYWLTPRILNLGFAYLSSTPFWRLAEPYLATLSRDLQESSATAVLDDTEVVYVLRVPARKLMRMSLGIGSRLPAYCTALGRVLLAGLPVDEMRDVLRRSDIKPLTPFTLTELDDIERSIHQVRDQGWCIINQEVEVGLRSVAAPIRDKSGRVFAAISVSGSSVTSGDDVLKDIWLPKVQETADEISNTVWTDAL